MSRRLRVMAVAAISLGALALAAWGAAARGNRWAMYEDEMQDPVDDPPDADRQGEFAFGRLRYRSPLDGRGSYSRWGIDCNKGDRLFVQCLRRLTRIDLAPIEHIVDIDSDEIFDWPWMFAVSAGDWRLSPSQATRLRHYLDRGGFLFVDDFHNDREWANFMAGIRQIDPQAEVRDLVDADQIFHVAYDLKNRIRVPGQNVVHGSQIERGGAEPKWRGVFDSKGRVIVAISFNQDVGDGWEFADDPYYPEKYSAEAIRLGVNYVLYSLTH